jgi:hypothetical protein
MRRGRSVKDLGVKRRHLAIVVAIMVFAVVSCATITIENSYIAGSTISVNRPTNVDAGKLSTTGEDIGQALGAVFGAGSLEEAQQAINRLGDLVIKRIQKKAATVGPQTSVRPSDILKRRIFPRLLWGTNAFAADLPFEWNGVAAATGYFLEYSKDQGSTWEGKKLTGALSMDANGRVQWTYAGAPETGLLLFRVSAQNANGSSTRVECGAWYNHLWKPLAAPSGSGIVSK